MSLPVITKGYRNPMGSKRVIKIRIIFLYVGTFLSATKSDGIFENLNWNTKISFSIFQKNPKILSNFLGTILSIFVFDLYFLGILSMSSEELLNQLTISNPPNVCAFITELLLPVNFCSRGNHLHSVA